MTNVLTPDIATLVDPSLLRKKGLWECGWILI